MNPSQAPRPLLGGPARALLLLVPRVRGRQLRLLAMPPPEVLVTPVTQQDVPIYNEFIGSLAGSVDAGIQARVSGYLISPELQGRRVPEEGRSAL